MLTKLSGPTSVLLSHRHNITPSPECQAGSLRCSETLKECSKVIQEAGSSETTGGLCPVAHLIVCICKSIQSKWIISIASSSYSIAVLRNKLFFFFLSLSCPFFIIFNKCDDSVFGKSTSFSFSHFPGAMSREGSLWPQWKLHCVDYSNDR